jgi:septin family protein
MFLEQLVQQKNPERQTKHFDSRVLCLICLHFFLPIVRCLSEVTVASGNVLKLPQTT